MPCFGREVFTARQVHLVTSYFDSYLFTNMARLQLSHVTTNQFVRYGHMLSRDKNKVM